MTAMKPLLSLLALIVTMGTATPTAMPTSDPPGKLGMWEGRWHFSGQIYETAYSRAHSDTGTADCLWTSNRGYLICDYFSDNPPHDDLAILSYSAVAKMYTLVNLHKDKPPVRSVIAQHGNTWVTSADVPDKGNMLIMQTFFRFLSADQQTTTVQVSADKGKTWTRIIEVTGVKVRGSA